MANTQDNLAAAGKIQEVTQRVVDAKQKVTTAQTAVDSAQTAVSDSATLDKGAAEARLAKAKADLAQAEQLLQQENEQLGLLLRPKPKDLNKEVKQKWPYMPYIVSGLLAVLFLLASIFWLSGASMSISGKAINVWFGLSALTIGLGLLTAIIVIVLHRTTQGRGAPSVWVGASVTVPMSRIRVAAQRVENAKKEVTTAQGQVDSAQTAVSDSATPDKGAAEAKLAKAKADLAAAQDMLQFEQNQFAFMMDGQSQYFRSGRLQYLVFGIPALVVLIFLMYGMINEVLLRSLASITVSRGLITFLIAVVTVTIALILVLATVVSESNDRDRRFVQGKEILAMLIGVLGTIVGFYFGNAADGTKLLQISSPFVSNESPIGGAMIDLSSFISGGKAPFSIEVTFTPPDIIKEAQAQSDDGTIRLTGLKTNIVVQNTKVFYQIKVRDSEGRTGLYDSGAVGKYLEVKKAK